MPNYPTLIPKTSTPTPETLPGGGIQLPALFSPDSATAQRVLEFFTANIRNPHTRKAYATAVRGFAAWTDTVGITHLRYVAPLHVAAYIEQLQSRLAAPSVKLQLAAIRMLFDWLVVGQIVPTNPASAVRGPKHSLKKGKTPALTAEEARDLLDSIATRSPVGLRDRALMRCSKCASRTYSRKAATPGCGSTRKAASITRCPVTTNSSPTCSSTSILSR